MAAELSKQRQREKQRQAFRAIKWTVSDESPTLSISQVQEIVNGTPYLRVQKEEVESAILTANDTKFRETNDTPAMTSLLPDLCFLGTTQASQDILLRTYVPCVPIDEVTRAFLRELQQPQQIPRISNHQYTAEEYSR